MYGALVIEQLETNGLQLHIQCLCLYILTTRYDVERTRSFALCPSVPSHKISLLFLAHEIATFLYSASAVEPIQTSSLDLVVYHIH